MDADTVSDSNSTLPPNWAAAKDKHSKVFYFNKLTKEVVYSHPAGVQKESKIPDEWFSAIDAKSRKMYYFNKTSGAVSWTKPNGVENITPIAPTTSSASSEQSESTPVQSQTNTIQSGSNTSKTESSTSQSKSGTSQSGSNPSQTGGAQSSNDSKPSNLSVIKSSPQAVKYTTGRRNYQTSNFRTNLSDQYSQDLTTEGLVQIGAKRLPYFYERALYRSDATLSCSHTDNLCKCSELSFTSLEEQIRHNHSDHPKCGDKCGWYCALMDMWKADQSRKRAQSTYSTGHYSDKLQDIIIICSNCQNSNKIRLPKGNERWATITTRCGGCTKQFETRNPNFGNVDEFKPALNLEDRMQCKYCDIPPMLRKHHDAHVRKMHEHTGPFYCRSCAGCFDFLQLFKKHKCRQWQCSACDLIFVYEDIYKKHCKLHGKEAFVCGFCDRSFKSKTGLRKHCHQHVGDDDENFPPAKKQKKRASSAAKSKAKAKDMFYRAGNTTPCCVCAQPFMTIGRLMTHQTRCFEKLKNPGEKFVREKSDKGAFTWKVVDEKGATVEPHSRKYRKNAKNVPRYSKKAETAPSAATSRASSPITSEECLEKSTEQSESKKA
eukprot:164764_1